jgi:hypothetical protein
VVNLKPARIALCLGLMVSTSVGIAHAQDADAAVDEYVGVLNQIENVKISTAQRELMMAQQAANIERLQTQIETVPGTKSAVRGIVTEMVAEIEKVIVSDLPFRKEERFARLDRLRGLVAAEDTLDSDLFRRAMTLYDIEANYGYTISAYTGDHPLTPGRRLAACREDVESAACNLSKDQMKSLGDPDNRASVDVIADTIKDGNYVHFGRLSFIYLDLDSREGFRWSKDSDSWEPLSSSDILNARKSVRIARGESAPGVVTAPIKVQASQ